MAVKKESPLCIALAGSLLLKRPSKDLVKERFGNDIEKYRKCVVANFPGADQVTAKEKV